MAYTDNGTGLVEPSFVKFYYDDIGRLNNLTGLQIRFLLAILKHLSYDNMIDFDRKTKASLIENLEMTDNTFRNTVSRLAKANIIKRVANGLYIMNPDLIFKGKQGSRAKLIIQYNELGERESIKLEVE